MENIDTMKSAARHRAQVRVIMVSADEDVNTMVWVMDQKVKNQICGFYTNYSPAKYVAFTPTSPAYYPLVLLGVVSTFSVAYTGIIAHCSV